MSEEQKQDIEVKIKLSQVNALLQRLGQLPYAQVSDLVENIRAIVVPQLPPAEDTDKPEQ